jgi:acyl-coenzyme A thioesterase PaaI-like protein
MPKPILDEQPSHCFGCGPANPEGLHLRFTHATDPTTGAPTVTAKILLTRLREGPPGYIHGGIIATVLDEAMSKLNRPLNTLAMTRHMEIDYLRPAPLHQPLILIGRHLSRPLKPDGTEGRKLFHQAELQSDSGEVLARAKGLFIAIHPNVLRAVALDPRQITH